MRSGVSASERDPIFRGARRLTRSGRRRRVLPFSILAALVVLTAVGSGCTRHNSAAPARKPGPKAVVSTSAGGTASTTSVPQEDARSSGGPGQDRSTTSENKGGTGQNQSPIGPSIKGIDALPMSVVGPVATPVAVEERASFGNGVYATVAAAKPVEVKAAFPGETNGAGVAVTIELENQSRNAIDLTSVIVDLTDSEGRSLNLIQSAPQQSEFRGQLNAGASASATYVFRLESGARSNNYLTVKYATDTPTVVFAGRITDG